MENQPLNPLEPHPPVMAPPDLSPPPANGMGFAFGPRGYTAAAWVVILLLSFGTCFMHLFELRRPATALGPREDRLGVILMEMQSKYIVGAASQTGARPGALYRQATKLNRGSIPQRQRFVILAGELQGREEAADLLAELEELIERQRNRWPPGAQVMTPQQAEVQRILHELYVVTEVDEEEAEQDVEEASPAPVELSPQDRQLLLDELGWFGELALAPPWTDDTAAREQALAPAVRLMVFIVIVAIAGMLGATLGFAGLIVLVVLLFTRKIGSGLHAGRWHHGIYAETFAVWMVLFLVLQVVSAIAAGLVPQLGLLLVLIAFFASLLALAWPVMRGIPWSDVRIDIGLTGGQAPAAEPLIGVGGYLTALPVLVVGAIMIFLLIQLQQMMGPTPSELDPTSGPAHPIVEQLAGGEWFAIMMVLLLGAVAAPIVEETMFRGVLYRHLRDATANNGIVVSIVISTLLNSFIFAIIHPQGWVGVPALMSLAIMFTLYREWRGSLIPAMIMHGVSNFLVLTMVVIAFNM